MRITRRDFLKYCAVAAGALGLTTTDLMKLEKAMATSPADGGTQVIWINGAACTGCTTSLANTAFFSSIQDLLVPWAKAAPYVASTAGVSTGSLVTLISGVLTDTGANGPLDLAFMETLSSSVGFRAIDAAKAAKDSGPFVLCIEGGIQTASGGDYCRIGNGSTSSDTATIAFMDEVREFALSPNCVAILAVGACATFGGIPAAKGSVTGSRGLISTGKISGGYKTTNTQGLWDYFKATDSGTSTVSGISLSTGGTGYTAAPTVTIDAPTGVNGEQASAVAYIAGGSVVSIVVTNAGYGYLTTPAVGFSGGTAGTPATATASLAAANYLTASQWTSLMGKTICIAGCPPHPDWIVGTIVYLLASAPTFEPPLLDRYHRPYDFYGEYQCTNCIWQTNIPGHSNVNNEDLKDIDGNYQTIWSKGKPVRGNSPKLYKNKYDSEYEGCLGILGCKGRKTKADCSFRRWNSDTLGKGGLGWCVQTRGGCHGCTEPRFPDGWGKFFFFK
jgi:Ni,Fe-hydrogenase I small subunit